MDIGAKQVSNTVGHDLVGRDKHETNYKISYAYPSLIEIRSISRLSEEFKRQRDSQEQFQGTIEKLEYFRQQVPEDIVGLELKLEAAQFTNVEWAKRSKEEFVKKLARYQFSEAALRIHTILLAEVLSRFQNDIMPLIAQGFLIAQVMTAVQSRVIEPVNALLGENVTELYADDLNGMLYFLTGNCHIKWVR